MNSRKRILTALNHQEPDRIPFDIGGANTTIHVKAYAALRDHLGLPKVDIQLLHQAGQVARLDEDFLELLKVDTRFVAVSKPMSTGSASLRDEGKYLAFTDSWGVGWRTPKENGLYFDMYQHPLAGADVHKLLETYTWPSASSPSIYEGQVEMAQAIQSNGKAAVLGGYSAGQFEKFSWLRGYLDAFTDFVADPELVKTIMDKDTLIAGYKKIINTVYSPKQYYKRTMTFLRNYKPAKEKSPLRFDDFKKFARSTWSMGIRNTGRRYYWKPLLWTLFNRPALINVAISASIYGFHFKKIFSNY